MSSSRSWREPSGAEGAGLRSRAGAKTAAVTVLALAPVLGLLYWVNPAMSRLFPPCPLHWLTGLHCPGCGTLRAVHLLLHGDVRGALGMNALTVVLLPVLGLLLVRPRWGYTRWAPWVAFGVLVVYGVVRNIPVWPLTLLAPH